MPAHGMEKTSIRRLARELRLSPATVSLALRESRRVAPATRRRVVHAATRAAYQPNPLVSSVMAGIRRGSHRGLRGSLACLIYAESTDCETLPFHREILSGAAEAATRLGCTLAPFHFGPGGLGEARLRGILRARGVDGVVVLPSARPVSLANLDWSCLAGAVIDPCLKVPRLTTLLPDNQSGLEDALLRLHAAGYRRPGLVVEEWRDARLHYRWSCGYMSFCRRHGCAELLPVLLPGRLERRTFLAWLDKHRPDVVLAHLQTRILGWLADSGRNVPDDVGYVQLNWNERSRPCAGLDLRPAHLGRAAVESVFDLLQRNQRGIPEVGHTILVPTVWQAGPTVRDTRGRKVQRSQRCDA